MVEAVFCSSGCAVRLIEQVILLTDQQLWDVHLYFLKIREEMSSQSAFDWCLELLGRQPPDGTGKPTICVGSLPLEGFNVGWLQCHKKNRNCKK